jgi:hypothetical protein
MVTVSTMNAWDDRDQKSRYRSERSQMPGWRVATFFAATVAIGAIAAVLVNVMTSEFRQGALDGGDQIASVTSLFLTVVGLVLALLGWGIARSGKARRDDKEPTGPTVERRIEEAMRSLQITAELVDELQVEMQAKEATLDRLRAENDEFEKLAALRKEEAEAVSRLIDGVISNAHSQLSRSSRRDQALFFLAGLAASIPVQLLVAWVI